jgi:AcrR family transcriptional regulator
MAPRRTTPQRERALLTDQDPAVGAAVVRRAPFSDNPRVGTRGQRTQQRILDASLRVFGEKGYHGCSIDRITKAGGCSRVSFYQYFAGKEDVFRHLCGQVARQLNASTEELGPLTPDLDGWAVLRTWVARYAEIYARYEPVFHVYQAAVEDDEMLAVEIPRTGEQNIARIHSRVATTTLPPRQVDPVIRLLLECLTHTLDVTGILRSVAPAAYPSERVEEAVGDVLHRTLFGFRADVNVHPPRGERPPALEFGPEMLHLLQREDETVEPGASATQALTALLASGRDVFVNRGFHNTRVDDLVAAAGLSHGAFYRYFKSTDQLARILTVRAMRHVSTPLLELPDISVHKESANGAAWRRWLRRYNAAHADEAAMLRVWVDAALQDPALRAESAPPLDWGRRWMARYLRPRGFGDVDTEAVVMVALLGVFGLRQRSSSEVEAAAHIIERGLLGR